MNKLSSNHPIALNLIIEQKVPELIKCFWGVRERDRLG